MAMGLLSGWRYIMAMGLLSGLRYIKAVGCGLAFFSIFIMVNYSSFPVWYGGRGNKAGSGKIRE